MQRNYNYCFWFGNNIATSNCRQRPKLRVYYFWGIFFFFVSCQKKNKASTVYSVFIYNVNFPPFFRSHFALPSCIIYVIIPIRNRYNNNYCIRETIKTNDHEFLLKWNFSSIVLHLQLDDKTCRFKKNSSGQRISSLWTKLSYFLQ